jgi:hypothetical protein
MTEKGRLKEKASHVAKLAKEIIMKRIDQAKRSRVNRPTVTLVVLACSIVPER